MLSLTAPTQAQLIAGAVGPVVLIELDFTTGTQRLCTWNDTLSIGGFNYTPVGGNVQVSNLGESEDTSVDQVTLTAPLVNAALLALVVNSTETYRGRQARLYLQLMNEVFQPVGTKVLRYTGYMEPAKISRDRGSDQAGGGMGSQGKISVSLSRSGLVRSRNFEGIRATHQQQQQRHPGDNGLEYVVGLINQPSPWLTIAFQKQ